MEVRNYFANARERALSAIIPSATETYSPIPHAVMIDEIVSKVNNTGRLEIIGQDIHTDKSGDKLVGFLTIRNRLIHNDEMNMMIGYKNSYDKSMSAGLAVGLKVMVCSNGMIAGDMLSFRRKHTGTVREELDVKIDESIVLMEQRYPELLEEVEMFKNFPMTRKQKAELLGVMYFEEELVTPHQLAIVKREFKESENFRDDTLWDTYNNVTEALKTSHPLRHIEDHIKLHDFMRGVAGINREISETRVEG